MLDVKPLPWRNRLAVAVTVATCVAGGVATVALDDVDHESAGSDVIAGTAGEQLRQLSSILDCSKEIRLTDDLYNFGPMQGTYCFTSGGDIIVARAYEAPRDLQIALQDWPLDEVGRYLVHGAQLVRDRNSRRCQPAG